MKLYLILLVISGIAYLITTWETKIIIKKYGLEKLKKSIFEERILAGIKIIVMWLMVVPWILVFLSSIFAPEPFEESVCDGLEKSGWG